MDINELREQIDSIDTELVDLYKKRMNVAGEIAIYKKENGMRVADPLRERELLNTVAEKAGEEFEAGEGFYFQPLWNYQGFTKIS